MIAADPVQSKQNISLEALSGVFGVFPIASGSKIPTIKEWQNYNNLKEVQTHHYLMGGNYGAVIGPKHLIIDVDPRNGGQESYEQLITDLPKLATLPKTVTTPGGGFHIYTSLPEFFTGKTRKQLKRYPGIDFLSRNMYVVAPGSSTKEGKRWAEAGTAQWPVPEVDYSLLDVIERKVVEQDPGSPAPRSGIVSGLELQTLLEQLDPGEYREHDRWMNLMASCSYICPEGGQEFASWSSSDPMYSDAYSNTLYRYESFTPAHTNPVTGRTLLKELPTKLGWYLARLGIEQKKVDFEQLETPDYDAAVAVLKDSHQNGELRKRLKTLWVQIASDSTLDATDRSYYVKKIAKDMGVTAKSLEALVELSKAPRNDSDDGEGHGQLWQRAADRTQLRSPGGLLSVGGAFYRYFPEKGHWGFISKDEMEADCQDVMLGEMRAEFQEHEIMLTGQHMSSVARILRNKVIQRGVEDPFNATNGAGQIAINTTEGRLTLSESNPSEGWMIQPHHPEQYQRTVCPVKFNPHPGPTPEFDKFLEQAAKGRESEKVKRQLLTLIGYAAASNAPRRRKCFFLHGGTATGKSVILDVLKAVLGRANTSSISLSSFGQQFALQPLVNGVLANISGEMSARQASARVFKELVSGDSIEISIKYSPSVQFENHATLVFAGNSLPRMQDDSEATRDRMCILPLRNTVPYTERDPRLINKLQDEIDNIFSKAILQFQAEMVKDNLTEVFNNGTIGGETLEEWYSESDPIHNWVGEMVVSDEDYAGTSFLAMYHSYSEWCKGSGVKNPRTRAEFSRILSGQLDLQEKKLPGGRGLPGVRLRVFADISWLC